MSGGFAFGTESGFFKGIIISNLNHFKEGPINFINLIIAEDIFKNIINSIFNNKTITFKRKKIYSQKDIKTIEDTQNYYSDIKRS